MVFVPSLLQKRAINDFQPQHWFVVVLSLTHENNNIFTNKYYESSNVNFIHYCSKGLSKLVFLIQIIVKLSKFFLCSIFFISVI